MTTTHFIIKCPDCGTVWSQCRCADLNKKETLARCPDCNDKKNPLHESQGSSGAKE